MKQVLQQIIYYATKAPSGHNTQPWKFELEGETIYIHPDYSRELPVVDPDHHELFISLGCALENLTVAALQYGYTPNVDVIARGAEPYIRVAFAEPHEPLSPGGNRKQLSIRELFDQLDVRQSTRNEYDGRPIPSEQIARLTEAARQQNAKCRILTRAEDIEPLIALVEEACVRQFSNRAFVDELVRWIRFNRTTALNHHDGLYSAVSGNPSVPEWLGKFILGHAVSPEKEADKAAELIRGSSAVAVFIGKRDDVQSWIDVGRSFERFALTATAFGIHQAHENMPCEERPVREKLARLLQLDPEEQPLLLVRLGYSAKMPYSYRRPVEEVVTEVPAAIVL